MRILSVRSCSERRFHAQEDGTDLLPYFDKYLSQKEVNAVIEKMHGH
jgi:hypothetical protein